MKTKPIAKAKSNTLRHPHRPKPRTARQREAKPAKPAKKARKAMTTAAADQKEQRGAGTGNEANATRSRDYKEGTKYTKGDAAKGRIDYDAMAEGQNAELIAARDRRAYLIDQAEKNEAANDELNAIQVEQNKKLQAVTDVMRDPDKMRDESMETAVAALKMHDPDERKKQAAAAQKNAEKGASPKAANQGSADFKSGQAAG